jgi:hypothetical protein
MFAYLSSLIKIWYNKFAENLLTTYAIAYLSRWPLLYSVMEEKDWSEFNIASAILCGTLSAVQVLPGRVEHGGDFSWVKLWADGCHRPREGLGVWSVTDLTGIKQPDATSARHHIWSGSNSSTFWFKCSYHATKNRYRIRLLHEGVHYDDTDQDGASGNDSDLYSYLGGDRFESQPGPRLSWLRGFVLSCPFR